MLQPRLRVCKLIRLAACKRWKVQGPGAETRERARQGFTKQQYQCSAVWKHTTKMDRDAFEADGMVRVLLCHQAQPCIRRYRSCGMISYPAGYQNLPFSILTCALCRVCCVPVLRPRSQLKRQHSCEPPLQSRHAFTSDSFLPAYAGFPPVSKLKPDPRFELRTCCWRAATEARDQCLSYQPQEYTRS